MWAFSCLWALQFVPPSRDMAIYPGGREPEQQTSCRVSFVYCWWSGGYEKITSQTFSCVDPPHLVDRCIWNKVEIRSFPAEANQDERPIALGGDTGGTWGHGWVDGWCSLFLFKLKLTALECDKESGNDWGRLDTAVTPSTILYQAATMTVGLMAGWLHVGGMHAYQPTQWGCCVSRGM